MSERDELRRVVYQSLADASTVPTEPDVLDVIADGVLAAYPQLAAVDSREEWGVKIVGCGATFTSDDSSDAGEVRVLRSMIRPGTSTRLVRRTVHTTPWEEAS